MESNEIRSRFLQFFEKRGHKVISSASLLPENDPTTLFTGSGMQPLLPYLLGQSHPSGNQLVNSQKCFRAEDIEEVGDNRHTTFFEMLGNWSLGDYWKSEQLSWFIEFLTKEIGLPKERLAVTCFEGDSKIGLPKDNESAKIWQKLGIPEERIYFYGAKKNWWSRSGMPENMPSGEPGGPDSEVFYEFAEVTHNPKFGPVCHPNCDCGRFIEIGNSVFMEYKKTASGFEKLNQRNVDFGGGLERITAASNDNPDIFQIDVFARVVGVLERLSGKSYADQKNQKSFRIVADHFRAAAFLISDGALPSNVEQGYFSRRLIRRAIRHLDILGVKENTLSNLVEIVSLEYKKVYPNLTATSALITNTLLQEETKFRSTLKEGIKEFEKLAKRGLSGEDAFVLFSSYGFPIDMTLELSSERGIEVDMDGFINAFKRHQELSRAGADKKFKGGLADHSDSSLKYHTATHLLHQALRDVLGPTVGQKGSNITAERLRFDFSHPQKMTDEEKREVENIVNQKIKESLPVTAVVLPKAEAEALGALHFFGEKYGDNVTVHYIGKTLASAYSKEFCGGPHVKNTIELGHFKIVKEEALSAGVRRIKAILE
jgi:alanyl-tRNA synthetase